MDEPGEYRKDSPRDHDPRDPTSSAPTFDKYRSRYLEKEVTDKEDPRAKPEDFISEAEIFSHPQRRVRHVDSIQKRDDEQQNQVRHYPPHDSPTRPIRN